MLLLRIIGRIIGNALAFAFINGIALGVVAGLEGAASGTLCGLALALFIPKPYSYSNEVFDFARSGAIVGGIWASIVGGITGALIGLVVGLATGRRADSKMLQEMLQGSIRGSLAGILLGAITGTVFFYCFQYFFRSWNGLFIGPSLFGRSGIGDIIWYGCIIGINVGFVLGACGGAWVRCSSVEQATLRRLFFPFGPLAPVMILWLAGRREPVENIAAYDYDTE